MDYTATGRHTGTVSFTESQEQILEATMQVIVREGLDSASMRAVAEEADVSLGLLSYHFEAKENLIVAAFRHASEQLLDFMLEQLDEAGEDPTEKARSAARSFLDGEFKSSEFMALWIAIWGVSRTNAEVAKVEQELHGRYSEIIARAIRAADPEAPDHIIRQRTTDLSALQNGLWLNWFRFQNRDDLERGLARCESIALGE